MHINIKVFETHSWKVQKNNVSNGWKSLEIRNKSRVGKKFIWSLEIYENWLWSFMYKTCLWNICQKWPTSSPSVSLMQASNGKTYNIKVVDILNMINLDLNFASFGFFDEKVMGTWSWTFFIFQWFWSKVTYNVLYYHMCLF